MGSGMEVNPDSVLPPARLGGCCFVAPDPALLPQLEAARAAVLKSAGLAFTGRLAERVEPGLNDGLVRPPAGSRPGLAFKAAVAEAGARQPLRGPLQVAVVLVDFSDRPMTRSKAEFEALFFAHGPNRKSVATYYADVSHDLVSISGTVVGPYRMPRTLAYYADGAKGKTAKVKEMALHALQAADPHINFDPYDNDHDGYVDAFVVVHAGRGAEQTNADNDIWSHKWTLPGGVAQTVDHTRVFAYLTIPEDAKLGVTVHELGHLLFGWPDLYDADYSSRGIGNFCVMAGGSWGGQGDMPCHPSAWCKSTQGWVDVRTVEANGPVTVQDVKAGHAVLRLWTNGMSGQEYFLVENRQRTGFDQSLPGDGLLVWHVDEDAADNTNETHPKVALVQADGLRDLERKQNSGDAADPFPGVRNIRACDGATTPNTHSYVGADSLVALRNIGPSSPAITLQAEVGPPP
jgi:immune inhibitor A